MSRAAVASIRAPSPAWQGQQENQDNSRASGGQEDVPDAVWQSLPGAEFSTAKVPLILRPSRLRAARSELTAGNLHEIVILGTRTSLWRCRMAGAPSQCKL